MISSMSDLRVNFVRQQGFETATAPTCDFQYPALMFQPRIIGVIVLAGVILQSPPLFLTLSAVLWWSALVPQLNPFDALYNALVATRRRRPPLTAAPRPRRFAQALAATFALLIGVSLLAGWHTTAWILEAVFTVAVGALVFGAFCLGSYAFHVLVGHAKFANRTLPWSRSV
jgi:Domain of unknown function (DUF4395)